MLETTGRMAKNLSCENRLHERIVYLMNKYFNEEEIPDHYDLTYRIDCLEEHLFELQSRGV